MKQVTRKQQPMFFLYVPGVLYDLKKSCTPNWKPGLNRRKNNFPVHCLLLFHPSKKDSSPASFWHCNAIKTLFNSPKLICMLSRALNIY